MIKSCSKKHVGKLNKFNCKICDYNTCKSSSWKKHILTKKHKQTLMERKPNICDHCHKIFYSRTTLWRHKKYCEKNNDGLVKSQLLKTCFKKKTEKQKNQKKTKNENMNNFSKKDEIIVQYEKINMNKFSKNNEIIVQEKKSKTEIQISELACMMKDLIKNQNKLQENMKAHIESPQTINNNNCNNSMTINMFLNNDCKNAMNLKDFVNGLKISWDDLDFTKRNGYINGISNIFVKQLKDLKPTERPIHCSDTDNLKFYYKDENKWEQDKQNEKMDESIKIITKKQMVHIKEWEQSNPTYTEDQELLEEWHAMILCLMGGNEKDVKTNHEEIKKKIGDTVNIEHLKNNNV